MLIDRTKNRIQTTTRQGTIGRVANEIKIEGTPYSAEYFNNRDGSFDLTIFRTWKILFWEFKQNKLNIVGNKKDHWAKNPEQIVHHYLTLIN